MQKKTFHSVSSLYKFLFLNMSFLRIEIKNENVYTSLISKQDKTFSLLSLPSRLDGIQYR